MNNEITCNDSRKHGTVTDFTRFTPAMLNSMKHDVGLAMSTEQLEELRAYYSKAARRDPTLDELYLLDRLLTLRGHVSSPIAKLSTDSSTIADTYADLMSKRKALGITSGAPSIRELQRVPAHYMEMAGKEVTSASNYMFAIGGSAKIELLLNGCTDILSTRDGSIGKVSRKIKYTPGSLLTLLPRTPDLTADQFYNNITALLEGPTAACVEAGAIIGELGLIDAVCKFNVGASIDATALPIRQPCAPEALCDACHGWVLAVINRAGFTEFSEQAKSLSIPCIVIGSLASGNKLAVKHDKFNNTTWDMNFISSLAPTRQVWLQPQLCDASKPAGSISQFVSDYSMLLATHTAALDSNAYLTSMATIFRAMSECVAHGADYSNVCVSVKITLPRAMMDTALEALLGIYRALIEYYVPDRDSSIIFDNTCIPTITVAAMAKRPHVNHAEASGNAKYLYLLSPRTNETGLPVFEELRRMWSYVTTAVRRGDVIAATALCSDNIEAEIGRLLDNSTVLEKACAKDEITDSAIGGMLILSQKPLDGLLIGTVTE